MLLPPAPSAVAVASSMLNWSPARAPHGTARMTATSGMGDDGALKGEVPATGDATRRVPDGAGTMGEAAW